MNIRKATINDTEGIRSLIFRAVEPESNPDFDEEGVQSFKNSIELTAIRERILNAEYLTICFIKEDSILGTITIHKNAKLSQLFVDPEARNMNISKKLWLAAKEICSNNGNDGKYWVKSSTMAIPVYESFGFRLDGTRKKENGTFYYPMLLKS